eukprot:8621277-Pyramimonas_sp.AAC.1
MAGDGHSWYSSADTRDSSRPARAAEPWMSAAALPATTPRSTARASQMKYRMGATFTVIRFPG